MAAHMAAGIADRIMLGDPTPGRFERTMHRLDANLADHGRSSADIDVSALIPWHLKADAEAYLGEVVDVDIGAPLWLLERVDGLG